MRRRAGKLIWPNPLLGSPDYQPLTQGMQAALPEVDAFLPAHNLESFRALARQPQALTGRIEGGFRSNVPTTTSWTTRHP